MNFIPSLSQQCAIQHKDGPMLVLAGPGSGKTAVITARTAHLIEQQRIPPEEILIITFTKAAARELYMRICDNRNNPDFQRVTVRTFHSFFYQILQHTYGKSLPTIISATEQCKIIRKLLDKNRIFPSNNLVTKDYLTSISKIKSEINSCFTKDTIENKIYIEYEQKLQSMHKMDMDDIQQKTYYLLQRNPSICQFWQDKYTYVMIDEYQDISDIQFQCIHLLFGYKQNVFVVGDDDQAIYGFRGARPEIMLNFMNHYPEGEKVLLETNYRCSKTVVESACNLIGFNKERFSKDLVPFNKDWTEPILLNEFINKKEQLDYIVKYVKQYIEKSSIKNTDLAILYRNHRQVTGLIDLFTIHKIPFYSKEGLASIHSHWVVQELLSTIQMAYDKTKCNKIRWFENEQSFCQWKTHMEMMQSLPPYGCVMYVRKALGYEQYLLDSASKTDVLLKEYMDILEQFTICVQNMHSWLEYENYVNVHIKILEEAKNKREGICLSTMHGAKGLEFDEVCILDVNEGTVPYKKAGLIENLEEERRLFYVAMTRAKRKLQLFYVNNSQQSLQPSRFLYEAFETKNLHQSNQLFTSNSSSLTNSSYSLASNHSSKASETISYSSSVSMLSKTGSSSSFSE